MKKYKIISFLLFFYPLLLMSRSVLRPINPDMPQLIAKWEHGKKEYFLRDSHIEEYPLFVVFKPQQIKDHLLPMGCIAYRYDSKQCVSGAHLSKLIEQVICEIQAGKKKLTHFTVLQNKDFSRRKAAGLIVLKFKHYPFVLKLFIETPESFVNPWCKGTQPVWFFYMGGGVNRHITGLTRIQNLHYIKEKIIEHPKWANFIDTPRKWFWMPKNERWVRLIGKNVGGKKEITTLIPGTYAIIADAIQKAEEVTIFDKHKRKIALEICNTFDMYIDPHIDNYVVEKGTNRLVIIDTEHFPTLVGLKEKQTYKTYFRWYMGLAKKATHDIYFRTKKERILAQTTYSQLSLFDTSDQITCCS